MEIHRVQNVIKTARMEGLEKWMREGTLKGKLEEKQLITTNLDIETIAKSQV